MPMVDIEATPDETKKITGANVKAQVLAGHKDLTTGIHGVGSNYIPQAPAASHLVRTFTKGWTVDKFLKGAGADADPAEVDAPSGADFPMKIKPNLVRWVIPGWVFSSQTTFTMVANRIYYIPIFVTETTTYIRIGIYVYTASAGNADLRIFNWSNGVPGSLLLNAGIIDTGATGDKEIIISQQLVRDYYFLAIRCDATPVLYGICDSYGYLCPVAGCNIELLKPYTPVLIADAAYADPAPAPTLVGSVGSVTVGLREN